jgi:hypothetical protein
MRNFFKIIILIITTLTISTALCYADEENNFVKIRSFEEIKPKLLELLEQRNPAKTLFVIPLEIIFRPKDEGFKNQDKNYLSLAKRAYAKIKESQKIYAKEVSLIEYENELIDPSLPDLIATLQEKGGNVIIMTNNLSGPYNGINYLEIWTLNFLRKHNIDLAQGIFAEKSFVLNNMTKVKGTYPTFYKGLLSCNREGRDNSYHQVLSTFLAGIMFLPDTIVMVQSEISDLNVAEMQFKLLRKDTEFIGFLYDMPDYSYSQLSPSEYLSFVSKFAEKVNAVKRVISKNKLDDPYEE